MRTRTKTAKSVLAEQQPARMRPIQRQARGNKAETQQSNDENDGLSLGIKLCVFLALLLGSSTISARLGTALSDGSFLGERVQQSAKGERVQQLAEEERVRQSDE